MPPHLHVHRADIARWCAGNLGASVDAVLFESGYLSQVVAVRLSDGRAVVVKVRDWQDRLVGCAQVQQALFRRGYPAPALLLAPSRWDGFAVSAEVMIDGGEQLIRHQRRAALFAEALAAFIALAPPSTDVETLAPSPPWVGWDHPGSRLWPLPDDRAGDLNDHPCAAWLDELAMAVRERLRRFRQAAVIGHSDWYSQNLHWVDGRLHAVHDWDSVVMQPEATIVGAAAAVWPGTGGPGEVASIEETEEFLEGYSRASGRPLDREWREASWAAGLWVRTFDAKKASLGGEDPDLVLTQDEAAIRASRAGLR